MSSLGQCVSGNCLSPRHVHPVCDRQQEDRSTLTLEISKVIADTDNGTWTCSYQHGGVNTTTNFNVVGKTHL